LEWEIEDIYEEPDSTCLCTHSPITNICLLRNTLNGNAAEVGNVCVKRFKSISSDHMFRSLNRVKKNSEKAFHRDIVVLAFKKGWIDTESRGFYLNTWRKHSGMSERQMKWRKDVNDRILGHIKRGELKEAA
jgi:hypothetical protein